MALDDECIEAVKAATEGKYDSNRALDVLDDMREKVSFTHANSIDALNNATEKLLGASERAVAEKTFTQFSNLKKAVDNDRITERNIQKLMADNPKMSWGEAAHLAMETKNYSDQHPMINSYNNYENNIKTMHRVCVETPGLKLQKAGLTAYAYDPANSLNIRKEFSALHDTTGRTVPGLTKDKNAADVAKIFYDANSAIVDGLRKQGVFIRDANSFAGRQTYDPEKLQPSNEGLTLEQFKKLAKQNWDRGRTMGGYAGSEDEMLKSFYDNTASGEHFVAGNEAGFADPKAVKGKYQNTGELLSQSRVIFWRDAEAQHAINVAIGQHDNFGDMMNSALGDAAKKYAAIKLFGTKPGEAYEASIDRLLARQKSVDSDSVGQFNDKNIRQKLLDSFSLIDGTDKKPTYQAWANIERAAKNWAMITKAPVVTLAHFFGAPITEGASFTHIASNRFAGTINGLKTWLKIFDPGSRQKAADLASSYAEGVQGHLFSDFSFTDAAPKAGNLKQQFKSELGKYDSLAGKGVGVLSMLSGSTTKVSGLERVMGLNRTFWEIPVSKIFADTLAEHSSFSDLNPMHASTLESYGIESHDWDLMRTFDPVKNSQGLDHVTPNLAYRLDDEAVKQSLLARGEITDKMSKTTTDFMVGQYKDDLANKIWLYLQDGSKMAIGLPGAKTKAWLSFVKENPNSQFGAAMRTAINLATFFKQWPTELIATTYGRDALRSQNKSSGMMRAISTAVGLTAAGFMTLSANALRQGKEPPNPEDIKTWAEAALRGGAGTVLSDITGGEALRSGSFYTRVGRFASGVGGSEAEPIYNLASDALKGKNLEPSEAKLVRDNFPKIWYTDLAVNYMFMYKLLDTIEPGWAQKEQEKAQKAGTPYFVKPTQAAGQ